MRLGVNVDHVATLRQQRRGRWPDPLEAALVCERAGASGIVCHLREDRRHIQDADVRRLRQAITTRLNLEMSIAQDIVDVAMAVKPDQVTLVPERRQELTTEGGLDAARLSRALPPLIQAFQRRGIAVSLFVDPHAAQVRAAHEAGATIIELHTGRYAKAPTATSRAAQLQALRKAARLGWSLGLSVAAGHGLDYDNVAGVAAMPEVEELNIGFSIIGRALSVGLETAVRQMLSAMSHRPTVQGTRRPQPTAGCGTSVATPREARGPRLGRPQRALHAA